MFRNLLALSLAAAAVGCVADASDSVGSQTDDISASSRTYVALRRDARKCAAPMCGGYFVHDVNRVTLNEKYVSRLDFTGSALDQGSIDDVLGAADGELVLRGKLGPVDPASSTQTFLVSEAYRGLPGAVVGTGAVFYATKDRNPPIECFTTPCNEELATKLNSTTTTAFTGLDVSLASAPGVDQAWVSGRALRHGGVVAGTMRQGAHDPGGYETILAATQVFVRLPDVEGPCAAAPTPSCASGQTPTYTRDENLCLHFDQCVAPRPCPLYVLACPDGYTRDSWPVSTTACAKSVCDPDFVLE